MISRIHFVFLPLLSLLLCGCYERETVVALNLDGGGTLTVRTRASEALLDYAKRHAGIESRDNWFNEGALKRVAATHGEGVRYREHQVENVEDGVQFTVVYEFDDIRSVVLRLDTEAPFLLTPPDAQALELPGYRFGGGPADGFLEIIPPPLVEGLQSTRRVQVESSRARAQREERFRRDRSQLMRHGNPFKIRGTENQEELAKLLTRGMRFELSLVLPAPILAGNARHVREEGDLPRITLLHLDAGEALKSENMLQHVRTFNLHHISWEDLTRAEGTLSESRDNVRIRWLTP